MSNLIQSYRERCQSESLEENDLQIKLLQDLSIFRKNLKLNYLEKIKLLFKESSISSCFYIFGNVGVGKTLIMDLFYNEIHEVRKKRIHFHEFMISTHESLHKIRSETSKIDNSSYLIKRYAKDLKKDFDLLCFDEFQVTNIADAMILGQLFTELFALNIKVILTSNDKPDSLYKDGLQRELFLPFIHLIKTKSQIFNLNINKDYRSTINSKETEVFFTPISDKTQYEINLLYTKLIKGYEPKSINIEIKKRLFEVKNYANNVAKFDFNDLCGEPLGSEDYLKLINNINILFIENVPNFSDENIDKQDRFITLIDILYDNEIKLVMSIEKSIENLSSSRKLSSKFERTLSRLNEMKSIEYWDPSI